MFSGWTDGADDARFSFDRDLKTLSGALQIRHRPTSYPVGRRSACRKAPAHFLEMVLKPPQLLKAPYWTFLFRPSKC